MTRAVETGSRWWARNFEALEGRSANGRTSASVRDLRRTAFSRFSELGFPTLKHENWRYTNVAAPLTRRVFALAGGGADGTSAPDLEPFVVAGLSGPRLVFVNGRFSARLSRLDALPRGVSAGSIAGLLDAGADRGADADRECIEAHLGRHARFDDRAFVALNTAFLADGAFVRIAREAVVEQPIEILFVGADEKRADGADGLVVHPRVLIFAERGSEATVIETHGGIDGALRFSNPVTEVVVAENARLDHFRLQLEGEGTYHVSSADIVQARSSVYRSHAFSFGGRMLRNDIDPVLDGEGSECTLNGLYVLGGEQHSDTHTVVDHARPHCLSNELYKGVLAGKSRGVFSGKIVVRQDAQKTNAFQSNKNLLLSGEATIDSKPQLEIFADDVKCSHGATVGRLDDNALFYLRSRGIPREEARRMLIRAFAAELLDAVANEDLRAFLERVLLSNLEAKT